MTGPVVTVSISADTIEVGDSTTVTVSVEDVDGESSTPMDLVEVRLSVTLGTFEPETAITDVDGECTFTYHAPDEVDGPTDVTITATAEQGVLDPAGTDEVTVTYRLEGAIIGPSQILAGGGPVGYIVKVTANGEPVAGVYVTPTVFGAGTKSLYTAPTNGTGETILTITPASEPGQLNMIVQIRRDDYLATSISKGVNVVEELAPLEVDADISGTMYQWGARRITATVVRGDDPVGGIAVYFSSSPGYFLNERVVTGQTGEATGIFIASHDSEGSGYDVNINISTGDGVEVAYFEGMMQVNRFDADLDFDMIYIPQGDQLQSQLYPGEQIFHEPKIKVNSGLIADMTLKFTLQGGNLGNHTTVLATGLSTFDLSDGSFREIIYDPGLISVYTVPEDPVEGFYTYYYTITDRTESHVYGSFDPKDPYYQDRPLLVNILDEGKDDWTFMYYLAGDNDLAPYMDHELERLENEAPDGEFKVYVMFDRNNESNHVKYYDGQRWWGAKQFDLEEGRESDPIPEDVTSSSAIFLYRFMIWVSELSPSGHYGLVLSDHGMGFKGMCYDKHRVNSYGGYAGPELMSLNQIRSALEHFNIARRKVEVVTLAACGMSGFEMATLLASGTDHVVASQLPTYSERGLTTEKVLQHLKAYDWSNYSPTPFQVSVDFVNGFIERSGGTQYDSSICVIDTDHVPELAVNFNATMRLIYNNWELLGECFSTAYEQTTRVPGPELGEFENGDMREFLVGLRDEVSSMILDPTARSVFNKLGTCIEQFDEIVIYSHLIQGLNGINLYMPTEPIPTDLGIFGWEYFGTLPFSVDYYMFCLIMNSGGSYLLQGGDGQQDEDTFTPLDPVDGYIIDDDDNGLGNMVVINLTPSQNIEQQPVFRVMIDCLQFSGMGGGYLSDMLKKRIVLEKDEIDGLTRIEVGLPVDGWYTIIARVFDESNEIVQKFIVGNYTMEAADPQGSPPTVNIISSKTTLTAGEELELEAVTSDPDGDEVDIFWDFDHRDGILFDSDEKTVTTRYIKPGNATVTIVATDGENTVMNSVDIVIEPAVGNNAPTAGMLIYTDDLGRITLVASEESTDPDGDGLQYRFNFGDGNWTVWTDEGSAKHHYSQVGTYNVSLRVRDVKGAVSERFFKLVTIWNVSDVVDDDDIVVDDDEKETGAFLIVVIAVIAVVVLVILAAGGVFLFLVVKKRKSGSDEDKEDEEAETW